MGNQPSVAINSTRNDYQMSQQEHVNSNDTSRAIKSTYFEPQQVVNNTIRHTLPAPKNSNAIFVEKAKTTQSLSNPIQQYYQLQPSQYIPDNQELPESQNPRSNRSSYKSNSSMEHESNTQQPRINMNRYSEYTGLKATERNVINTNQIDIEKIDPMGLLEMTPHLSLVKLAQTYVTLRNIHHPDKGGDSEKFIKIMQALQTIKWIDQMTQSDKTYMDLKKNFTESVQKDYNHSFNQEHKRQLRENEIPDKFKNMSNDKFNRLFEENRYVEDDDDGYGEFMEKSNGKREDIEVPRTLSKYKSAEFNKEFTRAKHSQKGESRELIQYQVPESLHSGNLGYVVLGDGKEKKYTGASGRLQYTDYMDAYTKDNTLVDDTELPEHIKHRIKQKNLQRSLNEYKRADLGLTSEQEEAIERYEKQKEREEKQREIRFREQVRKYEEYDRTIRNRIGY
jgi:hypothetical protein